MGFDIYGISPKEKKGEYFRSNSWGWRPIHALSYNTIIDHKLPFSVENWGTNDGNGLKNQEECDILADALEKDMDLIFPEDAETLYVCMDMWVYPDGKFIVDKEVKELLNDQYKFGTILHSSIITNSGELVQPAHGISKSFLIDFIYFLRNCGGFEIN